MTNSPASGNAFAITYCLSADIGARWDMGTCIPNAILGGKGYLVTHQNSIRKLSLITELNCESGGPPLKEFTNLQELSWRGLLSSNDCESLKEFLELHHEKLTRLELDFIDWAGVKDYFDLDDDDESEDDDEDEPTPLLDLILPKREDDYEDFLPNLQTFSLSAASFKGSWNRLMDGFNLHSVKELQLLNCERAVELLDFMARTGVCLDATKVELVLRKVEMIEFEFDLVDFLLPFNRLEDLFLMFESDYADQCYAKMVLRYRNTLRRLVFHRRHYCMAEKAPYWEEYCDSSLEDTEGGAFGEIFRETKLESVGLCGEPSKLQKSFQSFASRLHSLRLLHLRFTGKVERKPKFFNEIEAYGDSPSADFVRAYSEAERNGTRLPRHSPGPSEAEFRVRWEKIQGESWRDDEEEELKSFADWAFGPDGFPYLQVLASGDFSYRNRFADTQTLWCRNTGSSGMGRTWRSVDRDDIAENELIDANMDMISACPVSPLFFRCGRGEKFPGIS
jgi:hypothetical protein